MPQAAQQQQKADKHLAKAIEAYQNRVAAADARIVALLGAWSVPADVPDHHPALASAPSFSPQQVAQQQQTSNVELAAAAMEESQTRSNVAAAQAGGASAAPASVLDAPAHATPSALSSSTAGAVNDFDGALMCMRSNTVDIIRLFRETRQRWEWKKFFDALSVRELESNPGLPSIAEFVALIHSLSFSAAALSSTPL